MTANSGTDGRQGGSDRPAAAHGNTNRNTALGKRRNGEVARGERTWRATHGWPDDARRPSELADDVRRLGGATWLKRMETNGTANGDEVLERAMTGDWE